jgi:hypothetical protein
LPITEAQPSVRRRQHTTTIEVEVEGRWDALSLSELLIPCHSFLVQHDRERWVVHASAPGSHGESLADVLETIDDWSADRHPLAASCRVDRRPYQRQRDESGVSAPKSDPGPSGRGRKEQVMQRFDYERTVAS